MVTTYHMDELDRELLRLLQRQGFQSSQELAVQLKIGTRTIQRRIKNMRDEGIFKVIAVPNLVSFGQSAWAKIGIKVDPNCSVKVAHQLADHPDVYFVAHSLGTYDIMIAAAFRTLDQLTHFVNNELTRIEGVVSKETMLLVRPKKYYRYLWPGPLFKDQAEEAIEFQAYYSHYQLVDIDHKILDILMKDGLTRPATIKKQLGIAESTVRKRIKYMRDSHSITLEVVPNKEILEDEAWATIGINTRYDFDDKMLDAIVQDPNVYLVSVCLGRFDLVIAARFKNLDLLTQFISGKLTSIQGINSVQTFLHSKPIKYHNIRLGVTKEKVGAISK